MMRFLLLLFVTTLLFAEFDVGGHIDLDSQAYLTKPDAKHKSSFTLKQTIEMKYKKDDLTLFAKLYAQEDWYDTKDTHNKNERTFLRVDELFLNYEFEDDSLHVGKSVEFWGALELRNIVDVFNPKEFRNDIFSKTDKLGVYNLSYSHYTDNGELNLIVKFYEQDQKMAAYPYVYYIFPKQVRYDDNLDSSHGEFRPSIYLKYSGSTDSEYALDYAFIYENGYDSQRYFTSIVYQPYTYKQKAYLVNKFMTYNTLVVGSTLIKLEALYAKVYDDIVVGDYSHVALGFEHTLDDVYDGANLGLIGEYYNYKTYESDKYDDLKLFETMQNDLFLGLRYSFNNTNDSSVIGGVIEDIEYNEQVYYLKFDSRVGDSLKIELDYYYVEPSKTKQTAYAFLGRHQRVGLNIAYYF